MSRRKAAPKRAVLPDPLFGSELLTMFINVIMVSGKKSVAEGIVYGALQIVIERYKEELAGEGDQGGSSGGASAGGRGSNIHEHESARKRALQAFKQALDNVKPTVEVRSRRVGGSTYQVPMEVRPERQRALAMRWLVDYANERNEKTMIARLAGEILDALQKRGGAIRKREDVHRMAKANQAFAHYRW